jgi:hypothetical protein
VFSRVLLATALVVPAGILVSTSPAAALSCAPNQVIQVMLKATQPVVVAGQSETLIAKALNCTDTTLSLAEVDTVTSPSPCTGGTGSGPDSFSPHQSVKNTIPLPTSNCPGTWSFKAALYQGTALVAKSRATWTVTP